VPIPQSHSGRMGSEAYTWTSINENPNHWRGPLMGSTDGMVGRSPTCAAFGKSLSRVHQYIASTQPCKIKAKNWNSDIIKYDKQALLNSITNLTTIWKEYEPKLKYYDDTRLIDFIILINDMFLPMSKVYKTLRPWSNMF
jgi:hypothetical protein